MTKLTFKEVRKAIKNGEVTLVTPTGELKQILAFNSSGTGLIVEPRNGHVSVLDEETISNCTIKPNTKKYWIWAYKTPHSKQWRTTTEYINDDFRDTRDDFCATFASATDKRKLLYTEQEF